MNDVIKSILSGTPIREALSAIPTAPGKAPSVWFDTKLIRDLQGTVDAALSDKEVNLNRFVKAKVDPYSNNGFTVDYSIDAEALEDMIKQVSMEKLANDLGWEKNYAKKTYNGYREYWFD